MPLKLPAPEPLSVHLLYTCLSASFFYETDKAVTFWLVRGRVSHLLVNYKNSHFNNQQWFLTTLQSEISPKGANAFLKVSVSISGLRSPTKMWWWRLVSCLGVPPGEVAQFTWKAMLQKDVVFCNSTFISLPMQRRLFIAVIAALAAWWCANSTKQYGSLPEKNISQNLLMTWFSLPGSRMILHPFTGPIWLNRAIISSSVTWSISYQVSILVKIKAYQVSILILIKASFL